MKFCLFINIIRQYSTISTLIKSIRFARAISLCRRRQHLVDCSIDHFWIIYFIFKQYFVLSQRWGRHNVTCRISYRNCIQNDVKRVLRGKAFFDFGKQSCSFKTYICIKCVYLFQLCFGWWLCNGSVEGSLLSRSPKCEVKLLSRGVFKEGVKKKKRDRKKYLFYWLCIKKFTW
jgi:hypothetical protein